MNFAGPVFLQKILEYLEDKSIPTYYGYIWASCITFCFLTKTFLWQQAFMCQNRNYVTI